MRSNWRYFFLLLAFVALASFAFAQETTGGLQGVVKDPTGAVVSNATVEVTSPALIGVKKLQTDAAGYYRFSNLPPGDYTLTVSAPNFRSSKQADIKLATGHLPTIDVVLQVGATQEVVEVSGAAPIVDVSQSKVQTNVTEDILQNVPKGRSFQSVIQFAPGARQEPLQANGYQIDGASNTENSYLVEGQETARVIDGTSNTNIPMEFIQEVQVKSSGFEAEYGGALGGVVNVIGKRGSNQWHGSLVMSFRNDMFNAAPSRTSRYDPQGSPTVFYNDTAHPTAVTGQLDVPVQYYQPTKDKYTIIDPGFEIGGYLLKDRLWLFTAFVPSIDRETRTVTFAATSPNPGKIDFPYANTYYYSQTRLDFLATQKIRVFGSWNYAYRKVMGNAWPTADNPYGLFNTSSTQNRTNYNYQVGATYPNVIYNTGADITLTPNLVATSRFGYTFEDYQDRGLPVGIRYQYRNSNYSYGGMSASNKTSLQGTPVPAPFNQASGYASIGVNVASLMDKFSRTSFSQDVAYFKKAWGTHNFKAGYQMNRLWNDDIYGYNTAQAYLAYGTSYTPLPANRAACVAISAANTAAYGNSGVSASDAANGNSCRGLWGTVNIREYGETGKVSSFNHALYVQDAWTVGHGVTLNLGLRMDKENVPSYTSSYPGIAFGFGDKMAPRMGGSWDVLGNGKLKVFGSFGYFFDIMKYNMARGSFGGNYWHDCVYAMDTADYNTIVPTRNSSGHFCNPTGGANFTGSPALRFIENKDYRIYSNDPNAPGSLGPTGYIDPALKPMKQHEYVFGADWALTPTLAFETRYSRKRLDRTIEDAGALTSEGEIYYIVNPGEGHDKQPIPSSDCSDCQTQPKAIRNYDGVEFRLTKRSSGKWFGSLSYTYSRLWGNYSGLTSTDISDSGVASPGRNGANVDRNFDEPYMQFDAHGRLSSGPLATDRPNTFKAYGYYRLKYWKFETMLGAYQQWYSGTPLSTYMNVDGAPVFVEGRGKFVSVTTNPSTGMWTATGAKSMRGAQYSQTDFSLIQEFHVSKTNEKLVAGFEANLTNLFNQHSPTIYGQSIDSLNNGKGIIPDVSTPASSVSGTDYHTLMHGYNYISVANDSAIPLAADYGRPLQFQTGRAMRFKLRFTF
jgi:hypothetical protein